MTTTRTEFRCPSSWRLDSSLSGPRSEVRDPATHTTPVGSDPGGYSTGCPTGGETTLSSVDRGILTLRLYDSLLHSGVGLPRVSVWVAFRGHIGIIESNDNPCVNKSGTSSGYVSRVSNLEPSLGPRVETDFISRPLFLVPLSREVWTQVCSLEMDCRLRPTKVK